MKCNRSSGNILFLILIAVTLFAALSYAVTGSSRTSSEPLSSEKARLLSSQITNQLNAIQNVYTRMRLHCSITEMDVEKSGTNPNTPGDGSCNLYNFDSAGTSLTDQLPENSLTISPSTWTRFYANSRVRVNNLGSDTAELSISAKYVSEEVCKEFNKLHMNTTNIPQILTPNIFGFGPYNDYDGTFATWDTAPSAVSGNYSFCIYDTTDPAGYLIHHVLEAN